MRFHPIRGPWEMLLAMLFLGGCMKVAPKVNGAYIVRNERSTVVHVEAWAHGEAVHLESDSVMPGGSAQIYTASRREAKEVAPSVIFDDLRISTVDSTGTTQEIYHGMHDSDWGNTSLPGYWMGFEFVVQ